MQEQLEFKQYQEALSYAKEYAHKTSKPTTLTRNGNLWRVTYETITLAPKGRRSYYPPQVDMDIPVDTYHSTNDSNACSICDTPIGSSGECYNCEID